jgi:hypothetical protein
VAGRAALTLVLPEAAPDPAGTPEWRGRLDAAVPLDAPAAPGYARAAALCRLFGVATDAAADVPVAALGAADELPGVPAAAWLRADPVPLVAARAELRLLAAGVPELTAPHAAALAGALAEADVVPGARWYAPVPSRWYLALPAPARVRTMPPAPWVGRDVEDALPQGAEASRWRNAINAAQMVLHAAAAASEASGVLPPAATSVWFWGGGAVPDVPGGRFGTVIAHDPLARGLGRLDGARLGSGAAGAQFGAMEGEVLQVAESPAEVAAARTDFDAGHFGALALVHAPADGPARIRRVLARRRWWRPWTR